jgi:hypothetical protein
MQVNAPVSAVLANATNTIPQSAGENRYYVVCLIDHARKLYNFRCTDDTVAHPGGLDLAQYIQYARDEVAKNFANPKRAQGAGLWPAKLHELMVAQPNTLEQFIVYRFDSNADLKDARALTRKDRINLGKILQAQGYKSFTR